MRKGRPDKLEHEQAVRDEHLARFKGLPFPDLYTLIHMSPAYRTPRGRLKPAILTYAIQGHSNRRVRIAAPWRPSDAPLQVSIGKARRLALKAKGSAAMKKRKEFRRLNRNIQNIERGVIGPNAEFFRE